MRKVSVLVVIAMLALGVLGVAPSLSYASVIITDILVTSSDGTIYHGCIGAFGSCANQIWSLPTGGITLNPSDILVLTQNQQNLTGVSAYNFDTSDHGAGTVNVSINGGAPMVVGFPLNFPADDGSTSKQEAADWTSPLGILGGNAEISFGYADTLHTNACSTSRETSAVPNCLPGGGTFFSGVFNST